MKKLTLALSILALAISSLSATNKKKSEAMEISNKEKVVALLKSIETGDAAAVAYINPNNYVQHNQAVGDGLAGFGAVLHALPEESA